MLGVSDELVQSAWRGDDNVRMSIQQPELLLRREATNDGSHTHSSGTCDRQQMFPTIQEERGVTQRLGRTTLTLPLILKMCNAQHP